MVSDRMIGEGPPEFHLRTSLRQAVVVDAASLDVTDTVGSGQPHPLEQALRQSVFLDLLGSLVGVNGVTISVLSTGTNQTSALTAITPPGIDLLTPPSDVPDQMGRLTWAIDQHLQRAFCRVVVVAADVPALPTRIIATTLSSLAGADAVAGNGDTGLYLFGIRDEKGLRAAERAGGADGLDQIDLPTLSGSARAEGLVLRYVERRDRLVLDHLDEIREIVSAAPATAPRTATLLHVQSDAPTDFSVFGGFEPDFARGLNR